MHVYIATSTIASRLINNFLEVTIVMFVNIRRILTALLLLNVCWKTSTFSLWTTQCPQMICFRRFVNLSSSKQPLASSEVDIKKDHQVHYDYDSRSITLQGSPIMKYHLSSVNLSFPDMQVLNSNPPVFEIKNFLSSEQCHALIMQAQSSKSLGGMGASQTFSGSSATSSRTSSTCYLPKEAVMDLLQRVELLTGMPISHYEEAQICRYTAGQQYSWHYDSIPMVLRKGWGNRLATLIVYLNDLPVSAGGATAFRDLGLQVRPVMGKALLFFPSYKDGSQDDRVLHSGAITTEEKWIANIWVHEGSYDFLE